MNKLNTHNIPKDILMGFTAFAVMFSFGLSFCYIAKLPLICAFYSVILCSVLSLGFKDKILAADGFLLMPILLCLGTVNSAFLPVVTMLGGFIFFILKKIFKGKALSQSVLAGAVISLALLVTVMLTNIYFGIGAGGNTAPEMLASYRSNGFHPDFRGLLYGTITLFLMITYPFKFKKLSKIVPGEFVTLLLPLILNLFLNPRKSTTTVTETNFSFPVSTDYTLLNFDALSDVTPAEILTLLKGALFLGVILFVFSNNIKKENNTVCYGNACGVLTGIPTLLKPIKNYSVISCITAIVLSGICVFAIPQIIGRIPSYCTGSMMIVSAWQHLNTKAIRSTFKSRKLKNVLIFFLAAVSFILFDSTVASLFVLVIGGVIHD